MIKSLNLRNLTGNFSTVHTLVWASSLTRILTLIEYRGVSFVRPNIASHAVLLSFFFAVTLLRIDLRLLKFSWWHLHASSAIQWSRLFKDLFRYGWNTSTIHILKYEPYLTTVRHFFVRTVFLTWVSLDFFPLWIIGQNGTQKIW